MSDSVIRNVVKGIEGASASVSSIIGALTAGFAVVLAVWVFAGYELISSLGDVRDRVQAEHAA